MEVAPRDMRLRGVQNHGCASHCEVMKDKGTAADVRRQECLLQVEGELVHSFQVGNSSDHWMDG
jgi:hypothetical protein